MSTKDRELLILRKDLKAHSTAYHNATIQENFLRGCWDREFTPKGLHLVKKCVAFKRQETDIQQELKSILKEAQDNLHCSLMQHLQKVSENYHQKINTSLNRMSRACREANTSEIISHKRILSATKVNVDKFRETKHHQSCNKFNKCTGRKERYRSRRFYELLPKTRISWTEDLEVTTTEQGETTDRKSRQRKTRPAPLDTNAE